MASTPARKPTGTSGYKILTSDYRPPVQGGEPVWDGKTLPTVLRGKLDTSQNECAGGINFTDNLATALRIAGLWPNGRPSCCLNVRPSDDAIQRGDKWRCSELTIVSRVKRVEVVRAIRELSKPFGDFQKQMVDSQVAWYDALGRPASDETKVELLLKQALDARSLDWKLQRFDNARAVRAARAAWAAWAARAVRAARAARAAWAARDARAARAARAARDARAARAALTVEYAALNEWTKDDPQLLTTGLRDAYANGLGIVILVAKDTLGWSMD